MILKDERELIVEHGKKMLTFGLTKGTGGNLSIFNRRENLVAISPSGLDYFETRPQDIVIIDLDGNVVNGNRKPSSEYEMHLIFYKEREDVNAVVHTHSTYSTILSCMNWSLPPVHYLIAFAGKNVRCAEYALFGTKKLAYNALEGMGERKAVFLANHGLLTIGDDIVDAFNIAEMVEFCAEIYYKVKCIGEPTVLNKNQMEEVHVRFETYGQK